MPPRKQYKKKSTMLSRAGDAIKGRYFSGKGYSRPKLVQMAKDVTMLKSVINSEKKRYTFSTTDTLVGQCLANSSGYFGGDITPVPSQGTGYDARTGASIKLHSSNINFQFQQNSAQVSKIRGRIVLVEIKGTALSNIASFAPTIWNPNPFVSSGAIVDYNSQRNPDAFNTYRVLRIRNFTVQQDSLTGMSNIVNIRLGMKYNRGKGHHIRWDKNSATLIDGQIGMYVFIDDGNISSTTASTLTGTNTTIINSGILMSYNMVHYYYDN